MKHQRDVLESLKMADFLDCSCFNQTFAPGRLLEKRKVTDEICHFLSGEGLMMYSSVRRKI
jgi:hypothetical protein